jgi:1-phosphofructokinase
VLPADFYRRLGSDLTGNGGKVVADLSGAYLAAALAGGVEFLKISHEEAVRDGLAADDSPAELVRALHGLRAAGARSVVISRAEQPALALVGDDVLEVHAPRLEAADPRGAGDSMTAGAAAVIAHGGDARTAIQVGAAAGALNVTRHGLGTGRAEAVSELIGRVRLQPLEVGNPHA